MLEQLSTYEVLAGLLVSAGRCEFAEQQLLRFFHRLQSGNPAAAARFRVTGTSGRYESPPIRRALIIFKVGKLIELPPPNPVDQFYRPRESLFSAIRKDLADRGILPRYADPLQQLAKSFLKSIRTP
jgi:hypothetical protein